MRMGVVGLAKMMADEFGPYNITVNNVAPGLILTDRIKQTIPKDKDPEEALKEKTKSIPLGRIGKPEELAALVVFLASLFAEFDIDCVVAYMRLSCRLSKHKRKGQHLFPML